jgi:signal transduction histidine kinase
MIMKLPGEKMMMAFFQTLFMFGHRLWKVADPKAKDHLGVGAFNLVRRSTYETVGTYKALRMEVIDDMKRGLAIIAARSDSLSRFTTAYARLAKLPAPRLDAVNVLALVKRIAAVETRLPIRIAEGPDVGIRADPDQLEQLLINLVHNASDAALQTGGGVTVGWKREGRSFELWIDDEGAGLTNASNIFVPFFTTKPGGSGIGLVLSRQIAEAHGGSLTLENRNDRRGCRAYLRLPL